MSVRRLVVTVAASAALVGLGACGSDGASPALRTEPSGSSSSPGTTPSASGASVQPATYHGTLVSKGEDGTPRRDELDVGIFCATRCNLTGLSLALHPVTILIPEGGGKYRISMPAEGDICDSTGRARRAERNRAADRRHHDHACEEHRSHEEVRRQLHGHPRGDDLGLQGHAHQRNSTAGLRLPSGLAVTVVLLVAAIGTALVLWGRRQ